LPVTLEDWRRLPVLGPNQTAKSDIYIRRGRIVELEMDNGLSFNSSYECLEYIWFRLATANNEVKLLADHLELNLRHDSCFGQIGPTVKKALQDAVGSQLECTVGISKRYQGGDVEYVHYLYIPPHVEVTIRESKISHALVQPRLPLL